MTKLLKMCIVLCMWLGQAACAQESAADPFADIRTYQRDAFDRTETKCDLLAGHPSDPEKVSKGVSEETMDKPAAIAACLEAIKNDPENPRLNYQLARAYGYSGQHEKSDAYRIKALNAGYPQSLFVIGYIRIEGWDGRPADPCYGGELVRRSAQAGRFAGLVGFPHYVQDGRFENCESYPVIDNDELKSFLDQAETRADGYYQRILVKSLRNGLDTK